MKKKKAKIASISIVIALLMVGFYFYNRKDVEVLSINSNCNKYPCEIDFIVLNKTYDYLSCNLSIRGLKRVGARTSAAAGPDHAGEKTIKIDLAPRERKVVKETLLLKGSASKIQVIAWNIKRQM